MNRIIMQTNIDRVDFPEHLVDLDDIDKFNGPMSLVDHFSYKVGFYNILKEALDSFNGLTHKTTVNIGDEEMIDILTSDNVEYFCLSNEFVRSRIQDRLIEIVGKSVFTQAELSYFISKLFGTSKLEDRKSYQFQLIRGNDAPIAVSIPEYFSFDEICDHFESEVNIGEVLETYQLLNYKSRNWHVAKFLLSLKDTLSSGGRFDLSCKKTEYNGHEIWEADYDNASELEKELEPEHHAWMVHQCFEFFCKSTGEFDACNDNYPIIKHQTWEYITEGILGYEWMSQYKTREIIKKIMSSPINTELLD